ncbi:MAG: UvrD-helicase domain-containing protein [Clostridia bacterium]|nr:UvrD-helicase domain-containing protein [Clostridia bacterium]
MADKLNPQQELAVNTDGMELLISASAGTGKTSTMCRRILERITRDVDPLSLDRMLIVTFTNASAADMRRKMSDVLKAELKSGEASPERKERVRAQLKILPSARICTIDSYLNELVRSRFDVLGISPRMRIPDEAEIGRIREQAMDRAMEILSGDPEVSGTFTALTDSVLDSYVDSDLYGVFIGLYERIDATVKGIEVLPELAKTVTNAADAPFADSPAGAYILEKIGGFLDFCIGEYEEYLAFLSRCKSAYEADAAASGDPGGKIGRRIDRCNINITMLSEELDAARRVKSSLTDPASILAALDAHKSFEKFLLHEKKDEVSFESKRFRYVRAEMKDFFSGKRRPILAFSYDDRGALLKAEGEMLSVLYRLLSVYRTQLASCKEAAGIIEFSDIERYALRLLVDENGGKTPLAKELTKEFDEVYVDEYQDVNEIQDAIFRALSNGNRYMVGDVKQSIYGFRHARPSIFNGMRESYKDVGAGEKTGSIYFGENYRCSREIVAFVNRVCSSTLANCVDMTYRREDDLIYVEKNGEERYLPQICLVSKDSPLFGGDTENAEAAYTARCIRALIDGGTPPEDIAVLVTKMTGAPQLRRAFDREGIALNVNCRRGYFKQPEVLLLRCLIEMIDNPTKDVYLAGGMKSPVFGFTLDDLLHIREEGKKCSLKKALDAYAEKTNDPRAVEVLDFITKFRRKSREWTADRLVYEVMSETRLLPRLTAGVTPGRAAQIRDNLLYFYDLVRTLSGDGAGQIGRVLTRISDMEERDNAGDGKSATEVKGRVQLMTVHGSKGLQFRYCWLYGCGQAGKEQSGVLHFSERFGVDLRIPDRKNSAFRMKSEFSAAHLYDDTEKQRSERMRLLYVALTRARSRLYISAVTSKTDDELDVLRLFDGAKAYPALRCRDFLSMIFYGLGRSEGLCNIVRDAYPEGIEIAADRAKKAAEAPDAAKIDALAKEYGARLSCKYPRQAAVDLPVKRAVSVLYPGMLDEDGGEDEAETAPPGVSLPGMDFRSRKIPARAPRFIRADAGNDGGTSAERGTATHTFMQFCDLEKLAAGGVANEAKRLLDERFIDEKTRRLIDEEHIEAFVRGPFFKRMRSADTLVRERRFLLECPAADFAEKDETKEELKDEILLIQGVIDGFFIEKDGTVVLFDYKTDHFTPAQTRIPGFCENELRVRHTRQLYYYAKALAHLLGRPVDECCIYSFSLDKTVPVDVSAPRA